jgi:hypothetical protein
VGDAEVASDLILGDRFAAPQDEGRVLALGLVRRPRWMDFADGVAARRVALTAKTKTPELSLRGRNFQPSYAFDQNERTTCRRALKPSELLWKGPVPEKKPQLIGVD